MNGWAAASVCTSIGLALGGAFLSAYARDQARLENEVRDLSIYREEQAYRQGRTDQKLEQLSEGLTQLDVTLQREMRLLDATADTKIDAMDRRLQSEIQTLFNDASGRIMDLRNRMDATSSNRWTKQDHERFEDRLYQILEDYE